jgi:hypothetical protein
MALMHQQTKMSGSAKINLRTTQHSFGYGVRELSIPRVDKVPNGVHVVLSPGDYPNPIDAKGDFIPDPTHWLRYPFFHYICVRRQNPEGKYPRYENVQDSLGFDDKNPQLSVFDYYIKYEPDKVKNLSRAPRKAITVAGLTVQHQTPAIDKATQQVKHRQTGEIIYNQRDCSRYMYGSTNCQYCNDTNKYPYSLGKKYYMSLGSGHFEDIENISAQISARCTCGGTITLMMLTCPNCNNIVADANRGLTDQQMNDHAGRVFHCYHCHYEGFPHEYAVRCTRCNTPNRMLITDRVLALGRQVNAKKDSKIVLIADWSFEQYDQYLTGWKTTTKELVEKFGQPIDFNATGDLRSLTLSEQAEWLGLPVPEHMKQAAAQQDALKRQSEGQAQASQPTVGGMTQPYQQAQLGQPGNVVPNMGQPVAGKPRF